MPIPTAGDAITEVTNTESRSILPCDPSASHSTAMTIHPKQAAQLIQKKIVRQGTITD